MTESLGEILPNWLRDGEPAVVKITGALANAGHGVTASVFVFDGAETWWHTSVLVHLDGTGAGEASIGTGLSVGRHAAVYIHGIQDGGEFITFANCLVSIVNSPNPGSDLDEVMQQFGQLREARNALYDVPLGDSTKVGATRFRALCLVESLLITTELRVPGAVINPLPLKSTDLERLGFINSLLRDVGWHSQVDESKWVETTSQQSHNAAIVIPEIWAADIDEAYELLRDATTKLLAVLALNRGAAGTTTVSVIEAPAEDGSANYRVFPPGRSYLGNLIGGPISGEGQRDVVTKFLGIDQDPLVRLCCDLYVEALAERSIDARFLRLWSILEVLSAARVTSGLPVRLPDGSTWPGQRHSTKFAAPRVYQYIQTLLGRNIDLDSLGGPKTDMPNSVRAWYARRNATGHYGRFVPGDAEQSAQGWYSNAVKTKTDEWQWISSLSHLVERALSAELYSQAPVVS